MTGIVGRGQGEFIPVILPDDHCLTWGCLRPIHDRGLCTAHYREWLGGRHGNAKGAPPRPPCSLDGCDKPGHARGRCRDHYSELYNEARRQRREAERSARDECNLCPTPCSGCPKWEKEIA